MTGVADARAVQIWSYQELLDKSDLAVIATPTTTNDTPEQISSGIANLSYIGMETRFKVSTVLKGDMTLKTFVLHHYRPPGSNPAGLIAPDGPTFVYFRLSTGPANPFGMSYILFLVREADGRYAPVAGETDPGLSIQELKDITYGWTVETQTKLGVDIKSVLKECQTIQPGMTRTDLLKVFTIEGGLSTASHRTYVYHDCPYVKVDVDFAPSDPKQSAEKPTDIITKISKPYLDWTIAG